MASAAVRRRSCEQNESGGYCGRERRIVEGGGELDTLAQARFSVSMPMIRMAAGGSNVEAPIVASRLMRIESSLSSPSLSMVERQSLENSRRRMVEMIKRRVMVKSFHQAANSNTSNYRREKLGHSR